MNIELLKNTLSFSIQAPPWRHVNIKKMIFFINDYIYCIKRNTLN